jgi:low affinity Fe/Cu permease
VSNLINEILLRLAKAGLAVLLGAILYWILTGPLAVAGSTELALLCFLAAAAFVLLVQESPI